MGKSKSRFPVFKHFVLKYSTEPLANRWFDLPPVSLVGVGWAARGWVFVWERSGVAVPSGKWLWTCWIQLSALGMDPASTQAAPWQHPSSGVAKQLLEGKRLSVVVLCSWIQSQSTIKAAFKEQSCNGCDK